jgi:ParB family chromosome partitioning protein
MRKALGRGLEALLPGGAGPAPAPTPVAAGLVHLPVDAIAANPDQPRRHFEPERLAELAASVRAYGLLQPLVVRHVAGGFELIAGERRLRAARMAGLAEVPAVVREADEQARMEIARVETVQREDLTPLEEAEAYRRLLEEHGLTQDEVARRVGKSRPAVANSLRLLGLPEEVKARLRAGELSAGHARAVLSVAGRDAQVAFAQRIVEQGLPKREAERAASEAGGSSGKRSRGRDAADASAGDANWRAAADDLTRRLGTRVRLRPKGRGGTIEIEFYSSAELDRLIEQLRA